MVTDTVNERSAKHPFASVARIVKLDVPALVGVPASTPLVTEKVYGAVPPLPTIVWV